jgi:hypothetical protein
MKMKNVIPILTFFSLSYFSTFAQGQYFVGLPIQRSYNCESAQFISKSPIEVSYRPLAIAANCRNVAPIVTVAPQGFYLFKRNRKRAKITYPKTNNIIRF